MTNPNDLQAELANLRRQVAAGRKMEEVLHRLRYADDLNAVLCELASTVKEMLGDAVVAISLLDEPTDSMQFVHVAGLGESIDKIIGLLGMDPTRTAKTIDVMSEDELRHYRSGRLELVGQGLYGLMTGFAPKAVCDGVQLLLRVKQVYTIGLVHGEKHLGALFILARSDVTPSREMIEHLVNQAAFIIQRKWAERKLLESEQKYRTLFNTLTQGVVYQNAAGEIIDANPATQRILGVSLDQMKGVTSADPRWKAIREDGSDFPGNEHPIPVALKTGKEVKLVHGVFHPQIGDYIWIKVNAIPLFQPGEEKPYQAYATFEDITERKKAEDDLRQAYLKLDAFWNIATIENADIKAVCDHVLESIVRMTASRFGFYGFINEDESVMTIHSWSGEAMTGCAMATKPTEFAIAQAGVWGEAIRRRKPFILNDYPANHPAKKGLPTGHVPLANLMVVPVFSRGKIVSVAAVANREAGYTESDAKHLSAFAEAIQAIIDRKRAEEERETLQQRLNQTQKLESLGVLAGGIAHDFNNILSMIFGYIEMAARKSRDDKITGHLNKAFAAMDRARALTGQLLTFAKGGAPARKTGPLFPFIQETAQFALSGSNVVCRFKVPANLWLSSYDPNQIGQVIDNLVINAQQAMPMGGTLHITADNIGHEKMLPTAPKGDYVRISIQDEGIGIPKEMLPRIFDPFFTTKTKGHGLGLATCYSIVTRHGGCIDVESEPGKGSAFHIYLPAAEGVAAPVQSRPAPFKKGSGTFLVMDDEDGVLEVIREMLETLGFTVVGKADGQAALDFIAQELDAGRTIKGIILDLTIPGGMGGRETLEELQKRRLETPVFVASGYAEDPVMANPEAYGFKASICKPFRMDDLTEMLSKYLKF